MEFWCSVWKISQPIWDHVVPGNLSPFAKAVRVQFNCWAAASPFPFTYSQHIINLCTASLLLAQLPNSEEDAAYEISLDLWYTLPGWHYESRRRGLFALLCIWLQNTNLPFTNSFSQLEFYIGRDWAYRTLVEISHHWTCVQQRCRRYTTPVWPMSHAWRSSSSISWSPLWFFPKETEL